MVGGPLLVIIMMGTMLLQIPASVNEVYEVYQGVVTECKKYQYGISKNNAFSCHATYFSVSYILHEMNQYHCHYYNGHGTPICCNICSSDGGSSLALSSKLYERHS